VSAGDTSGAFETLAGVAIGRRIVVTRDGMALRISARDLFDLLARDADLLRMLFKPPNPQEDADAVAAPYAAVGGTS
jgi:hypothetical protein